MKKQNKDTEKKRVIAEYSELNQTEIYRSYGVKKKEGVFAHLNDKIATVMLVILYVLQLTILVLGFFWLTVLLGTIGIVLAVCLLAAFIWWKFFRVFRKRVGFLLKLKRACKSLGYKIKFYRGFFRGLGFKNEGVDLTVDTGKKLWTVRFLPCKKYNMDLIFEDEKTIVMKVNPVRLKGSLMGEFNGSTPSTARATGMIGLISVFRKSREKRIEYSFTDMKEQLYRKSERALIINPVPHTLKKKEADGAIYETGTGERMWGYTVFSGSGFINMLRNGSGE